MNIVKLLKRMATAIPAALAILIAVPAAQAAPYPGSLVTFTAAVGNTGSLFTFSGNTITVTGSKSGANEFSIDGTQLIGIRSLYLVNPDGSAPGGITTTANGGSVKDGTTSVTTSWVTGSLGGYTGYDDNGPGNGFPDGSHWLVIADPTLAGKAASNNDTSGVFTFSGPVSGYDIGVDYILAGGATGRAYFAAPQGVSTPEPASVAAFAFTGLGLVALMVRNRKRGMNAA